MSFFTQLNWLDIVVILVILVFALYGLKQGFIKGLLAMVVWIVAGFCAYIFTDMFSGYFAKWIVSPNHRFYIAFICIVIFVWLVGGILIYLIRALTNKESFGLQDSVFGFLFGAIKGTLFVSVVMVFFSLKPSINSSFVWSHSKVAPPILALSSWVISIIPEEHTQNLQGIHDEALELNQER
jgi:membrane protein required for colicin V production